VQCKAISNGSADTFFSFGLSEMSYVSFYHHFNRCFISTSPPSPVCLCSFSFGGEEYEEVRGDGLHELAHPSSLSLLCPNRIRRFDAAARSDSIPTPANPSAPIASDLLDDAGKVFGFSITDGRLR
jgi:hypothetical protein